MAEPKQKDAVDITIDFFFGAFFVDIAYGLVWLREGGRSDWFWHWDIVLIILFALTTISGSLAALFRNQFWSNYETYSNIPPIEETVSREAKVILWGLFTVGCASLGLLFIL